MHPSEVVGRLGVVVVTVTPALPPVATEPGPRDTRAGPTDRNQR